MDSQSRQVLYQTAQDGVSRERYRISRGQNYDGTFYASIGAFVYAGRDYDKQLSEWVSKDFTTPEAREAWIQAVIS